MALQDLLDLSQQRKKVGLSEERVRAIIPVARDYISFWREYPDIFVDFLVRGKREEVKDGEFKFYFYQRVFLRAAMRHQYLYAVFPRAYSKSFLSVMILMCKCILYPRCKLFVTSGGKEQAAGIIKENFPEKEVHVVGDLSGFVSFLGTPEKETIHPRLISSSAISALPL